MQKVLYWIDIYPQCKTLMADYAATLSVGEHTLGIV